MVSFDNLATIRFPRVLPNVQHVCQIHDILDQMLCIALDFLQRLYAFFECVHGRIMLNLYLLQDGPLLYRLDVRVENVSVYCFRYTHGTVSGRNAKTCTDTFRVPRGRQGMFGGFVNKYRASRIRFLKHIHLPVDDIPGHAEFQADFVRILGRYIQRFHTNLPVFPPYQHGLFAGSTLDECLHCFKSLVNGYGYLYITRDIVYTLDTE